MDLPLSKSNIKSSLEPDVSSSYRGCASSSHGVLTSTSHTPISALSGENPPYSAAVVIKGSHLENSTINYHQHHHAASHQSEDDRNVKMNDEELYAKFKEALKSSAETSTQIRAPIPGRKITFVPLQIFPHSHKRMSDVEDPAHFNKREDILKIFNVPEGNVSSKRLFTIAENRNDTDEGKYCCNNQFCCNAIGITGQAGIGKTTICKQLVDVILQQSQWKFDSVIYIPFRNIDYEKEFKNLLQFLTASSSTRWNSCKKDEERILECLNKDEHVLLILDGLDEASFHKIGSQAPSIYHHHPAKSESYIKNILCGNILPKAIKFVTSRERQMFEMNPACRPHFVSSVVGLNSAAREELCQQICGENSNEVMRFLKVHPNISVNCYVPVTCILIMNAINMSLTGEGDEMNCDTITSIMLYTLQQFVKSTHVRDIPKGLEQNLQNLSHLAMDAFSEGIIILYERDFRKFNIDKEMIQAFLQTHTDSEARVKILEGEKLSYFSHLTWQEFFSAIHMILFMNIESFSEKQTNFSDSKYEVCLKFVMGLCSTNNIKRLQKLFGTKAADLNLKLEVLKDFVSKTTKKCFSCNYKITFLQVCTWVYEAKHEDLKKVVADNLPSKLELDGTFLPSEVNSLHYVLRGCHKTCELKVGFERSHYVADSFERFFSALSTTLENPLVSLPSLNLDNNRSITDEEMNHISKCLCHIEHLSMRWCNISSRQIKILAKGLTEISISLTTLNLDFNNSITDEGMNHISRCLDHVKHLSMKRCEISHHQVEILAKGLAEMSTPIKILDLSDNLIGDRGANHLSGILNKVENVHIRACAIPASGIATFTKALRKRLQPLKSLNISGNPLGDDGAKFIAASLSKVKELDIGECNISLSGFTAIADGLNELSQPMKYLSLRKNDLGDDGAKKVSSLLSKIEQLDIGWCGFSMFGRTCISDAMSKLSQAAPKVRGLDRGEQ